MATTPRNNIVTNLTHDSVLESMDTLYEIADAELNSDKKTHNVWNGMKLQPNYQQLFAEAIFKSVQGIADRETELHGIPSHGVECVCTQIVRDWYEQSLKEDSYHQLLVR